MVVAVAVVGCCVRTLTDVVAATAVVVVAVAVCHILESRALRVGCYSHLHSPYFIVSLLT